MKLLLDTHLLLWALTGDGRLSAEAAALIEDSSNEPAFSVVSLWEVAIKSSLPRQDFPVRAAQLRHHLLEDGYLELPIRADHAIAVSDLPSIHRDPFDRILVAQARVEGWLLLTVDLSIAAYPGPIRKV